jgi:hypothetical protein
MGCRMVWAAIAVGGVAVGSARLRADLISHALVTGGGTREERYGTTGAHAAASGAGGFMGEATAGARYGRLSGAASVEASLALGAVSRALAEAAFADTLRIDGPPGASGAGFLVYTYAVDGSAEGEEADAHVFLRHGADPDEELASEVTTSGLFESAPHGFVFGQPLSFGAVLLVSAALVEGHGGTAGAGFGAELAGLRVFDAQMQPVSGWTLWSASGTSYPVPAPGAGAILLALLRARPRRARS